MSFPYSAVIAAIVPGLVRRMAKDTPSDKLPPKPTGGPTKDEPKPKPK